MGMGNFYEYHKPSISPPWAYLFLRGLVRGEGFFEGVIRGLRYVSKRKDLTITKTHKSLRFNNSNVYEVSKNKCITIMTCSLR